MDGSKYAPEQQSMIVFTDPDAYFNDVPVSFGPVMFDVLNSMADEVGEMEFLIGLSMRFPDDFANVVDLAAATTSKLGNRLSSMLLGNVRHILHDAPLCNVHSPRLQEPDLYAGHGERDNYTITDYVSLILTHLFHYQIFNT